MADFCKQCSMYMFGEDYREFADPQLKPGYANSNLCEGCGPIQTNAAGECISSDCDKAGHHVPHVWLDDLPKVSGTCRACNGAEWYENNAATHPCPECNADAEEDDDE